LKLNIYQTQCLLALLLFSVPVLELLYISLSFDAAVILLQDVLSGWKVIFGYAGQAAKIAVLFGFVFFLLIKERVIEYWRYFVFQVHFFRALIFLLPQLTSFYFLYQLCDLIFDQNSTNVALSYYLAWSAAAACCGIFSLLMMAPVSSWYGFAKKEWKAVTISLGISSIVWLMSITTATFWGPMSEYTFVLVALILSVTNGDELYGDLDEKVIGIGEFAVNIAPACSGYEGIGLITAFTAIYLYLYKREFRFPRAFILFPIGALAIWLLNAVRIAVLVLIGANWSPEVAVGGFHSQAGWITFISTSLILLWFAKKIRFFVNANEVQKADQTLGVTPRSVNNDADLAISTLVPMVVLLAVILISSAITAGFDWLYPLRVIAVIAALFWVNKHLDWHPYRLKFEAFFAGALVAVLWIAMLVGTADESNREFSEALWSTELWLSYLWLFFRFVDGYHTADKTEK
jgi:exosortase E/protease (VPEID-CTERM system)